MSNFQDRVTDLANTLVKELEDIGIYTIHAEPLIKAVRGVLDVDEDGNEPDLDKLLIDGDGTLQFNIHAYVNEVAWSERVQEPELFDDNNQLEINFTSDVEILSNIIDEDIRSGWSEEW
jgi:hypothetical protein